jgi:hypothetical protein
MNSYGYSDFQESPGYGISLAAHPRMSSLARSAGAWHEVLYLESGWDNHQDVYAFAKD